MDDITVLDSRALVGMNSKTQETGEQFELYTELFLQTSLTTPQISPAHALCWGREIRVDHSFEKLKPDIAMTGLKNQVPMLQLIMRSTQLARSI